MSILGVLRESLDLVARAEQCEADGAAHQGSIQAGFLAAAASYRLAATIAADALVRHGAAELPDASDNNFARAVDDAWDVVQGLRSFERGEGDYEENVREPVERLVRRLGVSTEDDEESLS